MAKAFSVASWNVEHFGTKKQTPQRIQSIIDYVANQKADVVAIYEVASKRVFEPLVKAMPNYQFHITEGPQTQEILIGVKGKFSAYVTQKLTFKSGQTTLRPGVLVTIRVDDEYYPLVFLHLKSAADPKGFGLRDDMLKRALDFRKPLDKAAGGAGKANYIFVGDLNTMGLDYPYSDFDIPASKEIQEINRKAGYKKMEVLEKNAPHTWWNGTGSDYDPSDLDHVVAAKHLQFKKFNGKDVDIRGWPKEQTNAQKTDWINKFSDHALLYFEVQKV